MFKSLKRRFRKINSKRRKSLKGGGISFAAKLGAFMLESVDYDVSFSEKSGFKDSQTQVSGVSAPCTPLGALYGWPLDPT